MCTHTRTLQALQQYLWESLGKSLSFLTLSKWILAVHISPHDIWFGLHIWKAHHFFFFGLQHFNMISLLSCSTVVSVLAVLQGDYLRCSPRFPQTAFRCTTESVLVNLSQTHPSNSLRTCPESEENKQKQSIYVDTVLIINVWFWTALVFNNHID